MKPYRHAKNSAKKYGGDPSDYMEIHNFIDESKAHVGDVRHRALLHNTFGSFLAEKVLGKLEVKNDGTIIRMPYIINSDGNKVQIRDVVEDHIKEDLGWIPSVNDYFQHMVIQSWFAFPKFFVEKLAKLIKDEENNAKGNE